MPNCHRSYLPVQRQPAMQEAESAPAAHFGPLEQEAARESDAVGRSGQVGAISAMPAAGSAAGSWLPTHELGASQPLDKATCQQMETHFGADLGAVRIHTNPKAERLSSQLNANAFATGSHIAFGPGQYNPASSEGKKLLAHELTHTIQQSGRKKGGEGQSTLAQSSTVAVAPSAGNGTVQKDGPAKTPCARADLGTMSWANESHRTFQGDSRVHIDFSIAPGSCACGAYRYVQVVQGSPGRFKGHDRPFVDPSQSDPTASGVDDKPYYKSDAEAVENATGMSDSPLMIRSRVRAYGEGENPIGFFKAWTVGMCLNPGQPDRVVDIAHWGFQFGATQGEQDFPISATRLSSLPEVWKTAVSTDFPAYSYTE